MAEEGINIANFILGRTKPGGDAVALLEVDHPIKESVIEKARAVSSVYEVTPLYFPAMEQRA
jgi:D-3-phosphoglycerate dehydrogenase